MDCGCHLISENISFVSSKTLHKGEKQDVTPVMTDSGHTRPVESKSLNVGKSLKIGKNRIKSEKSELIFYQTFLDFLAIY